MSSAGSVPPTLLNITIDSTVSHIHRVTNLNALPDAIVHDLFVKTLRAGKLTERVLRVFMATGNDQVLAFVKAFNIQPILKPILPTSKFEILHLLEIFSSEDVPINFERPRDEVCNISILPCDFVNSPVIWKMGVT